MADLSEESSLSNEPRNAVATVSNASCPPPAKKTKRAKKELPLELRTITLKDKHRIVVERRTLDRDFADGDFVVGQEYDVAVAVKSADYENVYDLDKLSLDHLRDVAKNLKVLSSSKMNKFQCKHAIAISLKRYNVIDGSITMSDAAVPFYNQLRYNTLVRLTNVIFSEDFVDAYMTSNDRRTRDDYEVGNGGRMERFWADVKSALESSAGGDDEEDDPYGVIDRFDDDPDERIQQHVDSALEDPKNYGINPPQILKNWTGKLMKVRALVLKNYRQSGEHESDLFSFAGPAAKSLKLKIELGVFPVYYFCLKASKTPNMDSKFQTFMDDALKGDSSQESESALPTGLRRRTSSLDLSTFMNNVSTQLNHYTQSAARNVELNEQLIATNQRNSLLSELESIGRLMENMDPQSERFNFYKKRISDIENELYQTR